MSIYIRTNYLDYKSVNDWFCRKINLSYRPLASALNNDILVSPADSRVIVFPRINSDLKVIFCFCFG